MLCEFSNAELVTLDLGILDRMTKAREAYRKATLELFAGHNQMALIENMNNLENLHNKLNQYIEGLRTDNAEFEPLKQLVQDMVEHITKYHKFWQDEARERDALLQRAKAFVPVSPEQEHAKAHAPMLES